MLKLILGEDRNRPISVLCLGCHSDDIEIGCGGTILRLIKDYPGVKFYWVVFSAIGARKAEAERACKLFVPPEHLHEMDLKEFQDGFMPFHGAEVKAAFEDLKRKINPDLIFTQQRKDAHQDHRLISELTWNTWRNHMILEYEIPKYDGDMGQPSVFFPLDLETCQAKVRHLMDAFQTQRSKNWFEDSTFMALMRLRGMECGSPSHYAEAFYCRKIVL